jgi:hypothetical protein
MNTIEIVQCLKKIARNKFAYGVFPCNKLPRNIRKPAIIIANTDPDNKPGKHWTAIFLPTYGPCEYFDSYGLKPNNKHFKKFLNTHCKHYIFNKQRLQSDFSTLCGNYCCIYLHYKTLGMPMMNILKMFNKDNYTLNDIKLKQIFKQLFETKRQSGSGQFPIICHQTCQSMKCE